MVGVPAQTGLDRPRPGGHLILDEEGVLAIGSTGGKRKRRRRAGIERVGVGDAIVELLVQASDARVPAGLPLVHTAVPGDGCLDVALRQAALLFGGGSTPPVASTASTRSSPASGWANCAANANRIR
jgi:hypothetical protein